MRIGGLEGLGEIFQFTAEAGRTGSCAERELINFVYRRGRGDWVSITEGRMSLMSVAEPENTAGFYLASEAARLLYGKCLAANNILK